MREDVKQKWVEALRSGDYTKTTGRLYRKVEGKDCHCTLGVLCDVALREQVPGVTFDPNDKNLIFYGPQRDHALLAEKVEEWAGLEYDQAYRIANTNDSSAGWTFEDMAAWIEDTF